MTFSESLISWYLQTNRDLPWRKDKNPYTVWLSEIILQQTKVTQGLPYFNRFVNSFPTIYDLANATESEVLKLWQGLGYYSRARNLHSTAKHIVKELHGVFPNNYNDLLKLKGIGDYTASAIASICFNEASAVVDGNVYRVLSRYYGIETPINSTQGKKEFKKLAQVLIDNSKPGIYNQAIMDFGALHCKPKNPLCETCIVKDSCVGLSEKKTGLLPVKLKKTTVKKRYFNYLIPLLPDNKTIFYPRKNKGIWEGLYEFPLLETDKNTNHNELITNNSFQKLFKEEVSVSLFNTETIIHKLSHQHLHTKFWIVETDKAPQNSNVISWEAITKFPVSTLINNFLKQFSYPKN